MYVAIGSVVILENEILELILTNIHIYNISKKYIYFQKYLYITRLTNKECIGNSRQAVIYVM